MKDLIGARGLKGDTGERGLPGKDSKCACDIIQLPSGQVAISSTTNIKSYPVSGSTSGVAFAVDPTTGSVIATDSRNDELQRLRADLKESQSQIRKEAQVLKRIQSRDPSITIKDIMKLAAIQMIYLLYHKKILLTYII